MSHVLFRRGCIGTGTAQDAEDEKGSIETGMKREILLMVFR